MYPGSKKKRAKAEEHTIEWVSLTPAMKRPSRFYGCRDRSSCSVLTLFVSCSILLFFQGKNLDVQIRTQATCRIDADLDAKLVHP